MNFQTGTLIIVMGALSACSIKNHVPDLEYLPQSDVQNHTWPELVPTDELANKAVPIDPASIEALNTVAARANGLRQRAAGLRTAPITSARVANLRARAAALIAAEF
ncbi:hypothetical protein GCM10008927_08980 [Amylibacter ulvae]|uniref:Uncharacterized protein n=1 Tax=Paramylibacter ulvae TaxID=1651968 RepID=A0ABQ3CW21_9RHOB|nr:hypothetical protein [Amylibacter ulvae]GHA46026.1 hypothetical protein GCM10008927_08980 [Amylibacter ulvae]